MKLFNRFNEPNSAGFTFQVMKICAYGAIVLYVFLLLDWIGNSTAPAAWPAGKIFGRLIPLLLIGPYLIGLGVFILRRVPQNIIGLVLIIWGVDVATFGASDQTPPVLAAIMLALIPIGWVSLFYAFNVFPSGKIPFARYQVWFEVCLLFNLFVPLLSPVYTANLSPTASGENPFFIPFLAFLKDIYQIGGLITVLPLLGGLFVFPIWRYRSAGAVERQQIRIVGFGGLAIVFILIFELIRQQLTGNGNTAFTVTYQWVAILVLPLVLTVAITRYRLYDIDIIIRRTVIYSILTTILAIVYFGGIVLLQRIFQNITGQNSELAIVASTLLIVAMFTPLRRRIQDTIDRRFYRRKYNAEQTIAKFNETLRDEVDLETLKANLVNVVQETLEPSSIRIWIKEPSERK
jgi:hypothetical protein